MGAFSLTGGMVMRWNPIKFARKPAIRQPIRKYWSTAFRPLLESLEDRTVPTNVTMYHMDVASTGQNLAETTLNPANVNVNQFGKLYATPMDGQVYAQPLYKTGVSITTGPDQGIKDIAIVCTEHNTVYAINSVNGQVLWSKNLGPSVPQGDVLTGDITNEIGITGTPVIDPARNIMFVIAKTKENTNHYVQRLWALNLSDGSNALGGPAVIADTTYNGSYTYNSGPYTIGNGDGAINVSGQNRVYFNALRENDRSSATLTNNNNNLYLAFASHGDNGPYHGWILYYDVSGSTMVLKGALNTTPNGGLGGIWEGGGGIVVDPQGFLYAETGNGTFDKTLDAQGMPINGNYGMAFIKVALDPTTSQGSQGTNKNGWGLKVVDYFVPMNVDNLNAGDTDLGSGGPLVLPDSLGSAAHPHLLVGGGKEGKLYLIDRDNMGHFSSTSDNVVQVVVNAANGILSTPTLYKNTLYVISGYGNDTGRAFNISNGVINTTTTSRTTDGFGYVGWTAALSANGASNGIVWILDRGANELRAYDAANLGTKLYTSNQATGSRDTLGSVQKFSSPIVADGKVFVGTFNSFVGYGLLQPPTSRPAQPTNLIATAASSRQVNLTWTDNSNIAANQEDTTTIERSPDGTTGWTVLGTVGRNITSYIDLTVAATTQYFYRVKATNTLGDSPYSPTATVTTPAPGTDGDGLLGTYFDNIDFTAQKLQRIDTTVNYDFGTGSPDPQIGPDTFSIRWTGQIKPSFSETYTLYTTSDDGIRLTVNGTVVVDSLIDQAPTEHSGTIALTAGQRYDIQIDYYENGGGAVAKLEWSSASQPRQVVPMAALFSSAVQAPNAPSNLFGTAVSGTQINLSWTDNSTNETGFKIERASDVNFTQNLATFQVGANVTTFQDTNGLNTGNTYFYRVRASSSNGDSNASNTVSVGIPSLPVTPSNSRTTLVTTTRIDFAWNDNANNEDKYEILRRIGSGGTYDLIATLPANSTTYSDAGLTPGTLYNYHIRAVNISGYADFTGVNTQTIPLAPTSLTATPGSGVINLAWTGSVGADKYNIYRGTSAGSETLLLSNSGGTTYTDTAVSGGVTYFYKVTAFNIGGESAFSNEVSASTTGNTPPVINSMTYTPSPVTNNVATFNVVASDNGGEANLTYTWALHPGGKPTGAADPVFGAGNGTNAGKNILVTFFAPGSYSFDLNVSDGTLSTDSNPFVVQVNSSFVVRINFQDNTSQGFAGYLSDIGLVYGDRGNGYTFGWNADNTANARNRNAAGSPDERYDTLTHMQKPGNPNAFWEIAVPNGTYQVHIVSGDPGGATDAIYKINVENVLAIDSVVAPTSGQFFDNTVTVTVSDGKLTISNATGSSNNKINFVDISLQGTVPVPANPTGLTATAVSSSQINLAWNDNSNNETGFKVERSVDGFNWTLITTTAANVTSYSDTGLLPLTTYSYRVRATNSTGDSNLNTNTATATTLAGATPPAAPSGLTASAVSSSQINLAWVDNSNNETGFKIERSTDGVNFTLVTTTAANVTSFNDTGLAASTAYTYRVRATNTNGDSANSNTASATTQAAPAGAIHINFTGNFSVGGTPTTPGTYPGYINDIGQVYGPRENGMTFGWNVDNTANGRDRQAANSPDELHDSLVHMNLNGTFTWSIAVANGTYTVHVLTGDPTNADVISKLTVNGVLTVNGSNNGGSLWLEGTSTITVTNGFIVVAEQAGAYDKIDAIDITPVVTAPAAPTGLAATAGNAQVALNWTASAGATSYTVYRGTVSGGEAVLQSNVAGTTFADTTAVNGTTYFYQVSAVNGGGESARSNEVSATPQAPAGLNFAGGFASTAGLTLNGTTTVNGARLELTNSGGSQAGSAFSTSAVNINSFSTQFDFQDTAGANTADGFTFTIQRAGATALGPLGGGLGYGPDTAGGAGGIATSLAIKFDLYNNAGEGVNSTGLYTNGAAPTNAGSVDLTPSGIDLHSGHSFRVNMNYNGTTLTVTILDLTTNATATQNYTINIASTIGGTTAFVGFTAGTGGLVATQDILNWTYSS